METKKGNRQSWFLENDKPVIQLVFGKPPIDISPIVNGNKEIRTNDYSHLMHNKHYDAGWGDSDTSPDLSTNTSVLTKHTGVFKLTSDLKIINEDFGSMIRSTKLRATTFISNRIGTEIIRNLSGLPPMKQPDLMDKISLDYGISLSESEQFLRILLALSWLEEV